MINSLFDITLIELSRLESNFKADSHSTRRIFLPWGDLYFVIAIFSFSEL